MRLRLLNKTFFHVMRFLLGYLSLRIKICCCSCLLLKFEDSTVCFLFLLLAVSGYVYLIFDSEKSVKSLLASCTHDFCNGGDWYFKISSRRMRCKEVMKQMMHIYEPLTANIISCLELHLIVIQLCGGYIFRFK